MSTSICKQSEPLQIFQVLLAPLLLLSAMPLVTQEIRAEEAAPDNQVILVLGDSLAAGHGLDPSEAFPALLQKMIDKKGWSFTVVNAGVSGDTTSSGLRRMDWLLRRKIDVLILELGGNDGLRGIPPETTRSNLQAIIDRTKKRHPEAQVIIAGMKMPPNMGQDYGDQFEEVFPKLAKQNNTPLIPFLLEGVGGNPELNLSDRIHPNEEGQRIVAENVWKVLRPVLNAMREDAAAPPTEPGQP